MASKNVQALTALIASGADDADLIYVWDIGESGDSRSKKMTISELKTLTATAEAGTLDSVTGRGATTTNGLTVGSIDINGEIIEKAVNTTSVTGSTALDPANGTIQRLTFSGAVTFTDYLADGESITLHIDDGTAYAATWPTIEWVGGSAPTLDTTNEHIIVLWKVNSTLYGMASGVAS